MSMSSPLNDVHERTQLTSNNQFELMLFRLGEAPDSERRELFGINVFKVREILVMPKITGIANAPPQVLGVANIRGQIIPVIDLPAMVGCTPKRGLNILMVTEYARTTHGASSKSSHSATSMASTLARIRPLAWPEKRMPPDKARNGLLLRIETSRKTMAAKNQESTSTALVYSGCRASTASGRMSQ